MRDGNGSDRTEVLIRETWPPALGPEGDDIYDLVGGGRWD